VAVGVVVGTGLAVLPLLLGAALYATLAEQGFAPKPAAIAAWLLGTFVLGAFFAGRFAAVSGMAVSRREGTLHGLVAWCVWALAIVVATAVAVGGGWIDRPAVAATLRVPDVEAAAWFLVGTAAVALIASLAGGARGARSEARAIGAWPSYEPAPRVEDDSYYAEEPLVFRGVSGVPTGI
jgi:hypothetical protein